MKGNPGCSIAANPPSGSPELLNSLGKLADTSNMKAFITVSDAAGRVLFRRPATDAELASAIHAVETAESEAAAAMDRIAAERSRSERDEAAEQ